MAIDNLPRYIVHLFPSVPIKTSTSTPQTCLHPGLAGDPQAAAACLGENQDKATPQHRSNGPAKQMGGIVITFWVEHIMMVMYIYILKDMYIPIYIYTYICIYIHIYMYKYIYV